MKMFFVTYRRKTYYWTFQSVFRRISLLITSSLLYIGTCRPCTSFCMFLYTLPHQRMPHLGRIDERSIYFDQDILYGKKNLVPNQARRRWWWRGRWEGSKQNRNMKVEVYNVFQVYVNKRTITDIWHTNLFHSPNAIRYLTTKLTWNKNAFSGYSHF